MINSNNPGVPQLLATLKQHALTGTLAQGPTAAVADALALTMQDTTAYTLQHSGVASSVAPSVLVAAFHPHVLADTLAVLRVARGEPAPALMVYTDKWVGIDAIPVNAEDLARYDLAWARPAPAVPAPPPVPPAPPAPPVPSAAVGSPGIAVPDELSRALAALDAAPAAAAPVGLVREAETVTIPTTGQPAAIIESATGQPLPVEKERAAPCEIVPIVAQEPTRWYAGVPAPADIAPGPTNGKGRPKLSPFAKAHPPRKKVGTPSPFWRDMQPMIEGLFVLGPANCPPDNTLGTLESFVQLVHVVKGALGAVEPDVPVGNVQDWLDDVWGQITESPAWPAIEASLAKYNAAGTGEGEGE